MTSILWLRRDLRVHDLPALWAGARDDQVVPCFCLDDHLLHGRHASGPRTQFLLECLADVDSSLRQLGSGLVIRHGDPSDQLAGLAAEVDADTVHISADVSPLATRRDRAVSSALATAGVVLKSHPGSFVVDDLDSVRSTTGDPYRVFTAFHRSWLDLPRREVHRAPRRLPPLPPDLDPGRIPKLAELGHEQSVLPSPARGGEGAGRRAMVKFLRRSARAYDDGRDDLGQEHVSRLSPYLHFGCISPRELEDRLTSEHEAFRRQLCWRDFYAHVLLHHPGNARHEHQPRYRGRLRWRRSHRAFHAWRDGRTGFPLVDAAMRQLGQEGWMHNRARLVVGSFLTKDLGIDWRWGERHFMSLLLDGDEASNNGNWQWIASVGVDPQPVHRRIFNPALQQARHDPQGSYVRRYVPELREVPNEHLAEPWKMPAKLQRACGCVIGRDYPEPIVDHTAARREALERYRRA